MKFTHKLPLSSIVLLSVGLGLIVTLLPVASYMLAQEYREVEYAAERQGIAALDMLESVHANAMAFRQQTEDNDPAIDTLNGTLEQFSEQSENVRLWLVMAQKVIDFQLANNQTEVEGPLDKIDEKALEQKTTQMELGANGMLRITRPVILGKGSASNEKCASCHTGLMKINEGEPIGALSAEVNMQDTYLAWRQQAFSTLIAFGIVIVLTLGLIFLLLRATVLTPVARLSEAADKIAKENDEVEFEGEERPDALGKLARSLNLFQANVRERINLELQAEHSRQLADAATTSDRAKSEFLANMSHEIRTPMNGVMGMAELLAKTKLDAKQSMFTDVIVKSGSALLTIINDILDFSKIDSGQMELDPAPFRIAEAIEDVATLVSSRVSEKDIELIVRIDPMLPTSFVGDVGRIRQIVTNLMGNAVKFTEQGHVYVNLEGSVLENGEAENKTAKLRVTVEDTGVGIPADKINKVFEKFSQVDTSASRKHEGTGLGLSIASSLVELMGGQIGVDSEFGEGSTFWFEIELPVYDEHAKPKQAPVDVSGSRILIVDDNAVNRSILTEQMTAWKFDCAAVVSGEESLTFMKAAVDQGVAIDCVVMDYHMPNMNGGDAVLAMKADTELANIPVIMLTSVDETEDGRAFSSLGIQGHLTKPARSSLLLETIVQVLHDYSVDNQALDDGSLSGIALAKQIGGQTPIDTTSAADKLESINEPAAEESTAVLKTRQIDDEQNGPSLTHVNESESIDVLVCEDNEVNQIVFTQILQQHGLKFRIANNGRMGVEQYKKFHPSLILMDVSMPEMNGLETTRAIREIEKETGNHTPIIGVTAHAIKGDKEKCMEAGMDDYLPKPVSPDALTGKIDNWIAPSSVKSA